MADADNQAPLYSIEPIQEKPGLWRVVGPNGAVADYPTPTDAQARADLLNEQIAEETEDDY